MTSHKEQKVMVRREPYLLINIILAGIIILVMAYSGIFSPEKDNYPVKCIHQELTGQPCVSCGLSHSFSLIVRGRVHEAMLWNIYGLRIFIFFAAQLLMRTVFSVIYIRYTSVRGNLIFFDITGSAALFLISFWHFFVYIFRFS